MLAQLTIRDIVLIDRLDLELRRGPDRPHRRDRRRQVHPARRPRAGARRPRRRLAGPPRREAGPGHRGLRPAARPSGLGRRPSARRSSADGSLILRRVQMADGRTRAFVNDAPVSAQTLRDVGRALVEIHGQHDDRALVDPAAHRALLDAFGGLEAQARRGPRAAFAARRGGRAAPRRTSRPGSPRPGPMPTTCTTPTTSSPSSKPEPGEEEALGRAARRDDAGREGRRATCATRYESCRRRRLARRRRLSALLRRLERRAAQAPDLDRALPQGARRGAGGARRARSAAVEDALRGRRLRPARARDASRSGCSRCAPPPASTASRSTSCRSCWSGFAAELAALDAGEARLAGLAAGREAARGRLSAAAAASCRRRRRGDGGDARRRGQRANSPPLKLERARFITADRGRRRNGRPGRHRPGRVLGLDQSRHPAGAADQGRLGRRARALHAGPEGVAGRPRLGADAGLRRDRHRRRRRRGGRHRLAPGAAVGARSRCSP